MGIRTAIVLSSTSFMLGILFSCWIADHGTLWESPVTTSSLSTSLTFYRVLVSMPYPMRAVLACVMASAALALMYGVMRGIGIVGSHTRERDHDDFEFGAEWVFEGGALFVFAAAGTVWINNALPALLAIEHSASPALLQSTIFKGLPLSSESEDLSNILPPDLITAITVLASAHIMCSIALTGVIALQTGQAWSKCEREQDRKDLRESDPSVMSEKSRRAWETDMHSDDDSPDDDDDDDDDAAEESGVGSPGVKTGVLTTAR